jgi:DNA mismatch repair ATPase MutS
MTGKNKQAFSDAFAEVRDVLGNLTKKTKESLGNLNLEFQRAQSAADKLEKEVSNGVGETFEEVSAEIQKIINALKEYDASTKNAAEGQL